MSEIAKLYNDVMAGVEAEKLAADQSAEHVADDIDTEDEGIEINAEFFSKVASGDEEAVEVMNNFIEEARAEGATDEEIEAAIAEAMQDAGIEEFEGSDEEYENEEASDDSEDEFEVQKAAAYFEGAEQAIVDALESELAKEAGVTIDDLVEYELGAHYGTGYAETRSGIDVVIEKIAAHKQMEKEAKVKEMLGRAGSAIKGGAKGLGEGFQGLGTMARSPREAVGALRQSIKSQGVGGTIKGNKKELAALGTLAAGTTALGVGGKKLMNRNKNQ